MLYTFLHKFISVFVLRAGWPHVQKLHWAKCSPGHSPYIVQNVPLHSLCWGECTGSDRKNRSVWSVNHTGEHYVRQSRTDLEVSHHNDILMKKDKKSQKWALHQRTSNNYKEQITAHTLCNSRMWTELRSNVQRLIHCLVSRLLLSLSHVTEGITISMQYAEGKGLET